jgi:hypothetical protein
VGRSDEFFLRELGRDDRERGSGYAARAMTVRRGRSDNEVLLELLERIRRKVDKSRGPALTEPERTVWLIMELEADVNNGGFDQYFFNEAGNHAGEAPAALRKIGASRCAQLVERALAVFGPRGPNADRDARQERLMALPESATDRLDALDSEFYTYPDDTTHLLAVYARKHGMTGQGQ